MNLKYHELPSGLSLLPEEQDDPLMAVDRLYDATDLEYLRCYLWQFFKSVIADEHFAFNGEPVIAWETVDRLEMMIDVFHSLKEKNCGSESEEEDKDPVEADRQYLCNLYKIHADYGGSIRRLTIEEVNDLRLFAKAFFAFKSHSEWKSSLRQWLFFAISAESLVYATSETQLAEIYERLEKLLEATYLLHQRRSMIAVQTEHIDQPPNPKFPSREEASGPISYICRYFSDTTLSEHLSDTKDWIQAVFGDYVWNVRPPSELVWFHDESVKLIEVAYQLYHEKETPTDWQDCKFDKPLEEASGYRIFPHYLNEKEAEDPWLVLDELSTTDADEILARLREWLMQALNPKPIEDHKNSIHIYHLLQKLAEALYIIAVRVTKAEDSSTNSNT